MDIKDLSTSGWYLFGISILSGAEKRLSMEERLIFSFFFSSLVHTGNMFTFSFDLLGELVLRRPNAVGRSPLPRLTYRQSDDGYIRVMMEKGLYPESLIFFTH